MAYSLVKRKLLALRLRVDPEKAIRCVHALALGDSPYSLARSKNPIIGSMGLAYKLNQLYKSVDLQFLFELQYFNDVVRAYKFAQPVPLKMELSERAMLALERWAEEYENHKAIG